MHKNNVDELIFLIEQKQVYSFNPYNSCRKIAQIH